MPLSHPDRSRSGLASGVRSGMWSAIALKFRSIVIRARLAPMQKCAPVPPKPTCGLGLRKMSKVYGSSKTSSSKLAER